MILHFKGLRCLEHRTNSQQDLQNKFHESYSLVKDLIWCTFPQQNREVLLLQGVFPLTSFYPYGHVGDDLTHPSLWSLVQALWWLQGRCSLPWLCWASSSMSLETQSELRWVTNPQTKNLVWRDQKKKTNICVYIYIYYIPRDPITLWNYRIKDN